jgi:S1-C subfamily serine protease
MYGFEFMHSHDPDSLFLLISNSMDSREKREAFDGMGRQLWQLVQPKSAGTPFTLGIAMGVSDEGVVVDRILADSAAEAAGLKVGDRLISAAGVPLGDDPLPVLRKNLTDGSPILFKVRRDATELEITLTPQRRKRP